MQPYGPEPSEGLSPERVGNRLWPGFLQQGGAERFGGHSCRSEQPELRLSPEIWARTQHKGAAAVAGEGAFQKEEQRLKPCWPAASWDCSTLSANLRTGTTESHVPLSKGCTLGRCQGRGSGGTPGGLRSPLLKGKMTKKLTSSSSVSHPQTSLLHQ